MKMDDRKKRILQAIIDDYIDTAEPIGSRTIAKRHELGLSSATIRNEMADLEEMGYLAQPHTSAGRIPSDKGYRLYVDQLMQAYDLQQEEINNITSAMELRISELNQLIRQASAVLSSFTKYTSMAVTPPMKSSTIKAVQLVPIEIGKAMAIVVTNTGIVRSNLINISNQMLPDTLNRVSNALNSKLNGLSIEQVGRQLILDIEKDVALMPEMLTPILNGVSECINQIDNTEVYVEGTTNILNHPEFRDIVKAKEFMSMLDGRSSIVRKLFDVSDKEEFVIKIGSENDVSGFQDCSLVAANYNIGDTFIGTIGVIGPTRMEYPKVISSVNFIRNFVSKEISKLLGFDYSSNEKSKKDHSP